MPSLYAAGPLRVGTKVASLTLPEDSVQAATPVALTLLG